MCGLGRYGGEVGGRGGDGFGDVGRRWLAVGALGGELAFVFLVGWTVFGVVSGVDGERSEEEGEDGGELHFGLHFGLDGLNCKGSGLAV